MIRGLVRLQLLQSVQNQGQRRPKEHFCIWGEGVELVSDYQWSQIHKVQSHASLHPVLNDKKKQIKTIHHCNALYDYERFFQERAPDGAGFAPVDSILGWFPVFGPTAYVCWASTRGGTGAFWVANFHSKLKEIPGKGARGGGQRTLGTKSGWIGVVVRWRHERCVTARGCCVKTALSAPTADFCHCLQMSCKTSPI